MASQEKHHEVSWGSKREDAVHRPARGPWGGGEKGVFLGNEGMNRARGGTSGCVADRAGAEQRPRQAGDSGKCGRPGLCRRHWGAAGGGRALSHSRIG